MPIYGKNFFKKLPLQNQLIDILETWYVALGIWVLLRLFKRWPWVDLDPITAKVKFGHLIICMGKSENYLCVGKYYNMRFHGNFLNFGLKTAIFCCLQEYMRMWGYRRSGSFFDSHSMTIWNISSEATGPVVIRFYVELSGNDGTKICSNGPDLMTNIAAMPVDSKNL